MSDSGPQIQRPILRRIYFDNDALMGRWPARVTGGLEVLVRLATLADVQLCVPETVVVEHKHSTIRHVVESIKKAATDLDRANDFLNGLSAERTVAELDINACGAAHDQAVEKVKETHGFIIIPCTTKSVTDFVREAASHGLAFKSHDTGFRDAVHLHSALEHLTANPLAAGEEAVFITRDEFLASAASEAGRPLGLRSHKEPAVLSRLKSMVATPDSERLLRAWAPIILADIQLNLMEDLVDGLERAELIPHVYLWDPRDFEATNLVAEQQAVAPMNALNLWAGLIPIRLRGEVLVAREGGDIPRGTKTFVAGSLIEAQISVSVTIEADAMFQIHCLSYESASLDWSSIDGGDRIDSGSPALELLRRPLITHPQE